MYKFILLPGMTIILFLSSLSARSASSPSASLSFTHTGYSLQQPAPPPSFVVKKKKLNFFERIIYKMTEKKIRKMMRQGDIDADKLARQSNLFGWLSLAAIFIFPLASIPLGILAIIHGTAALRNGTSMPQKAKTGRTTGIIALSLIVISLIVVLVIIAGLMAG
jgi:hypothetical protein